MEIPNLEDLIIKDPKARKEMVKKSHLLFFITYFPHVIEYRFAKFQKSIFAMTEDENIQNLFIMAFRGSGKSTIVTTSYVMWSILGVQQKKFIIILGLTQAQARQHLKNIRMELETNELLKKDLGPLEESDEDWNSYSIVIPKHNARIMAVSMDQSIRGAKHGGVRPDVIIADDIEDIDLTRTYEQREKVEEWLTREILPLGDKKTRFLMLGNMLHEDSLMNRMYAKIKSGELDGVFKKYPLINRDGKCLWKGKFPTEADLLKEKKRIGSNAAWNAEYLLIPPTLEDAIVKKEWIKTYEELPVANRSTGFQCTVISVDPAISKKVGAAKTGIVCAKIYLEVPTTGGMTIRKIYILPNIVNSQITHLKTVEKIENIRKSFPENERVDIWVESVGYQQALVENLLQRKLQVEAISPKGQDKESRLQNAALYIEKGEVFFPERGAEILLDQILYFGREKYNDLADAFSMLVNTGAEKYKIRDSSARIVWGGEPAFWNKQF